MKLRARLSIYHIGPEAVFLTDDFNEKSPTPTITNDAEAVVEAMLARFPGRRIFYRDTEGEWDELLHHGGKFCGYRTYAGQVPTVPEAPGEVA